MPFSRSSSATHWFSVPLWRSAACFANTNRSTTGVGATTQPTRNPGASTFENVPHRMTLPPSPSVASSDGPGSRSYHNSPYGSSSTTPTPAARAQRTSSGRRSGARVVPWGFWKLGMV